MLRKIISYVNLSRSKIEYFSYLTLEKIIMLIFHFYFIRSINDDRLTKALPKYSLGKEMFIKLRELKNNF